MSDLERDALAAQGRKRQLARGETLFHAGDQDTVCATLVSGALKIRMIDAAGDEHILALVHPAGFIGELYKPFSSYDVVALGASELCLFARADMTTALAQHPALTHALLRRTQEDVHASRELLAINAMRNAKQKIGALLMAFAKAASDSPCHPARSFELPLTRGEIANLAGLTIETVSRQLSILEKEGAISKNGARGIDIADPALLLQLAETGR
ncbi:MAG: Crp/Fnr family transcriptional regulator [Pontixanthobacter sp.]